MHAYDYPVEHFQMMAKIASYLKSIEVQLLRSEYMYDVFGSWLFTFRRKGEEYRLVFDGRDGRLSFENDPTPTERQGIFMTDWTEVIGISVEDLSNGELQAQIESVVQQGLEKADFI